MATKNIQLKNADGDLLNPKTVASLVINNAGHDLGGVEAGAQVNIVETIKVNGQALAVTDKAVNIEIPDQIEYTIAKAASADEGYIATYQLAKDGVAFGTKINIPKDYLVKSGSVKECTQKDAPVAGYNIGDKYLDFVVNTVEGTGNEDHIYILVKDLVDTYTGSDFIDVAADNKIAIKLSDLVTELKKTFAVDADVEAALATKQDNLNEAQLAAANSGITAAKLGNLETHVANADIHVTAAQKTEWSGKQDALTAEQLAAANSGITAAKVANYDGYAATIAGKADKATTLAGYGIADAYTKNEIDAKLISYVELG